MVYIPASKTLDFLQDVIHYDRSGGMVESLLINSSEPVGKTSGNGRHTNKPFAV